MKTYTVKSSAHRAARNAGLTKDQYEIVEVDGRFGYRLIEQEAPVAEVNEVEAPVVEETVEEQVAQQPSEEAEQATEAPAKSKAKPEIKRKSDIERPTKAVWHIADEMFAANPNVRRKDVIAECVRRGIAYYTARTQYQQWLTAVRNSKKDK